MILGERLSPSRAPHPDLPKATHQAQGLEVAAGLHPRADDRQHRRAGLARRSVATAETAAVRTSVMSRPSIVTKGSPVSGSKRRIVA